MAGMLSVRFGVIPDVKLDVRASQSSPETILKSSPYTHKFHPPPYMDRSSFQTKL